MDRNGAHKAPSQSEKPRADNWWLMEGVEPASFMAMLWEVGQAQADGPAPVHILAAVIILSGLLFF